MIVTIGDDGQLIVNKFSETPDDLSDTILIDIHNSSFTFSKIGHIQLCHSHIYVKSRRKYPLILLRVSLQVKNWQHI
jgi:hypothetical protein